ncbi:methyl-accepting chemotaxis protein [Xylanibacillus composti]|uniref:Putative sensory transducer protein YvaQ n=1 Tax=Xylanibacillus composti TaxID=1572762 RepID=A0A8J4H7R2_9BACL|nr:methyl-accepting chemotaxis protein [Xylanibacillus composti]GIQ71440.1 putative sensory transducer protein YvaQ [Xylanibacillus composti]
MLSKFNHLRIGTKLFGVLLLATVALVVSNGFLMQSLKSTAEELEQELYDELYYATHYLLNADRDFYQAEQAFMSIQANESATSEQLAVWTSDFHENIVQVTERMNQARDILTVVDGLQPDQVLAHYEDFFRQFTHWQQDVEQFITHQTDVPASELERLRHEFNQTRHVIDVLQQDLEHTAVAKVQALIEANQRQMLLSWGLITLCILIVFMLGFLLIRHITKPVARLVHQMQEIADGSLQLHLDAKDTQRQDEVGQLARSSHAMVAFLLDIMQKLKQISSQVDQQSAVLTQAASEVRTGSEQVSATMQQLSAGAEEQASTSGDISSLIDQLNKQIVLSNEDGRVLEAHAKNVHQASDQGKQEMARSVELFEEVAALVADSTDKVNHLELRIDDISKLSEVIKGIAEQTNLLALNAAIESARAGEAGKGFAVVAAEVRKLSVQVNASVGEIAEIIQGIQAETRNMAHSMAQGHDRVASGQQQIHICRDHFTHINAAVAAMTERIQSVTSNLVQIAANSEKVSLATTEIAAASEEAAAGIEQCAATAQQQSSATQEVASHASVLKERSGELHDIVKQFRY